MLCIVCKSLFLRICSVVAARSVRHVRAAHDCMRQQAIITPDSRLTASLSAAQNSGKVAHTVRRYGTTEQLRFYTKNRMLIFNILLYLFSCIVGGGAYDAPCQPSDPGSGPSPKGLALLRKAPAPTRFIATESLHGNLKTPQFFIFLFSVFHFITRRRGYGFFDSAALRSE